MLLAALLGNSNLRFALLREGEVVARGVTPVPADGSPFRVAWPSPEEVEAAAVASVNPPRLEGLLAALASLGRPVLVAGRDLPVPIPNRYLRPEEAGMDRLLNALAAARLHPGRGVVVLDFGTALSVSVVSPSGEFLGGPIAAGAPAVAAGLLARTARLPPVRLEGPPRRVLARETREALEAGVYCQVAGGAARLLEALAAELPFSFTVLATGGDAALFAPALPRAAEVDPDLTLKGLEHAYRERPR